MIVGRFPETLNEMIDSAGMLTSSIFSSLKDTFFFSIITSDFTIIEFAVVLRYFP